MNEQNKKINRKRLSGIVKSDRALKTRVVEVERLIRHMLYKKAIKKRKTFYAHDENNISKIGDRVIIEETRPMSKLKRWRVVEVKK